MYVCTNTCNKITATGLNGPLMSDTTNALWEWMELGNRQWQKNP